IRFHRLIPVDNLPRVCCHSSYDSTHCTVCSIFSIVNYSIITNRFEKLIVLLLIRVWIISTSIAENIFVIITQNSSCTGVIGIYNSFSTLEILTNFRPRTRLVSTLTRDYCTTWIFEFYKMVIEYFSVLRPCSYQTSSHTLCRYRVFTNEPVSHINIVNMLF